MTRKRGCLPTSEGVITHQHGDHTGGNAPLLAANAEIVVHKQARANMLAGNMPGIPRITFNDELQVFLGGKGVVARHLGPWPH